MSTNDQGPKFEAETVEQATGITADNWQDFAKRFEERHAYEKRAVGPVRAERRLTRLERDAVEMFASMNLDDLPIADADYERAFDAMVGHVVRDPLMLKLLAASYAEASLNDGNPVVDGILGRAADEVIGTLGPYLQSK